MESREDNHETLDHLLASPASFVRKDYSSFLFTPFSRKLNRRVYLQTRDAYALWVRLESDPLILNFNERVPRVPIVTADGVARNDSPRAISIGKGNAVTVHCFDGDLPADSNGPSAESPDSAWAIWAQRRGFECKVWTSKSLRSNPVEYANLKHLLRFISAPGVIPNHPLQQALLAELGNVRQLTFFKLAELFPLSDPDEVQREIVRLILDRRVFSDIVRNPFSMITELTLHHGLETN